MEATDLTFSQLRDANHARQKLWDGDDRFSVLYYSNALAGEVGELCNVVKKLEREKLGKIGSRAALSDLAKEIADVQIYLDLLAHEAGIDLAEATREKFNQTSIKYGFDVNL